MTARWLRVYRSLLGCSSSIRCSIRFGMIRASKNSSPRLHRNKPVEAAVSAAVLISQAARLPPQQYVPPQPCGGCFLNFYFKHANFAEEDGRHFAHDNICEHNKNRPRPPQRIAARVRV